MWREIWRTSLFHLESKGIFKGSEGNPIGNLTEIEGKAKGIPFWNLRELEGTTKGYPVGIYRKLKGNPFGSWQKLKRNLLFLAIPEILAILPILIILILFILFRNKLKLKANQRNQNPHANRSKTNPGQLVWWLLLSDRLKPRYDNQLFFVVFVDLTTKTLELLEFYYVNS